MGLGWVLPPLSNSWIINILWLYIAVNRTLNIDFYGGRGGSTQGFGVYGLGSEGFLEQGLSYLGVCKVDGPIFGKHM